MENFNSVDEILDFAISKEQEAADYYNSLAEKMEKPWMADTFKGFAREEMGHKSKLVEVKKTAAVSCPSRPRSRISRSPNTWWMWRTRQA